MARVNMYACMHVHTFLSVYVHVCICVFTGVSLYIPHQHLCRLISECPPAAAERLHRRGLDRRPVARQRRRRGPQSLGQQLGLDSGTVTGTANREPQEPSRNMKHNSNVGTSVLTFSLFSYCILWVPCLGSPLLSLHRILKFVMCWILAFVWPAGLLARCLG